MELFGTFMRKKEENLVVSESGFNTLAWNVEASEGRLTLTQDEENENLYTLQEGEEKYSILIEKQVHQKVNKTWKIDGTKLSDGTTIKLNGTHKGDYEVWSNATFNSKGNRAWKKLSTTKSEAQGKKNLAKAIKEYKATLKSAEAKAE